MERAPEGFGSTVGSPKDAKFLVKLRRKRLWKCVEKSWNCPLKGSKGLTVQEYQTFRKLRQKQLGNLLKNRKIIHQKVTTELIKF